jgi:hypothetical protein
MHNHKEEQQSNKTKMAVLENNMSHVLTAIGELRQDMKSSFDKVDQRFIKMDSKIDSHFKWTLGLIILGILLPLAPIIQKLLRL